MYQNCNVKWDVGFMSMLFPSMTHIVSGLSPRSKLANFFSLFVCFFVHLFECAILGWNTGRDNGDVLSKAFDCVRWTSLIDFASFQTFFRGNYRGLVEMGRNALWLFLVCSQQIVWRSRISEAWSAYSFWLVHLGGIPWHDTNHKVHQKMPNSIQHGCINRGEAVHFILEQGALGWIHSLGGMQLHSSMSGVKASKKIRGDRVLPWKTPGKILKQQYATFWSWQCLSAVHNCLWCM